MPSDQTGLFSALKIKSLALPNRFVLPAMQRGWSVDGVPTARLADYYVERVEGGAGLIISESVAVDHTSATQHPIFSWLTDRTVAGWADCIGKVHGAGGRILLQLWHEGSIRKEGGEGPLSTYPTLSPSGLIARDKPSGRAATAEELVSIRDAFARSAKLAQQAGADGVEVHAAHGYLLDQFLWPVTNRREDGYGGDDIRDRVRFPAEVVGAIREACGPDFIISLRFSQWKEADFGASIAENPDELEIMLDALRSAGVDLFHVSTRRFWQAEWPTISDLGLAAWTRQLSDLPVITVGSVGLSTDVMESVLGNEAEGRLQESIAALETGLSKGYFDLVSVGRSQIADPQWVNKVRDGRFDEIKIFRREDIGLPEADADLDHIQST